MRLGGDFSAAKAWVSMLLQLEILSWVSALVPSGLDPVFVEVETRLGTLRGTRRSRSVGIGQGSPYQCRDYWCHTPNPFATTCSALSEYCPILEELSLTVDEFLGIPYAAPPVADRRFKPPERPSPWQSTYDATYHRHVCPQDYPLFNKTHHIYQDEDCLYLNIYSPFEADVPPPRTYPVMVFIHGGSYVYGTGNRYNGTALAQRGIVFVSINYRLGALGFLTTGDKDLPGNYGLLDQIQALKWIRENIRAFRGDPDQITIFGSSAGGASVGILLLSPMTKGLFHRAIAQSGTANAVWASHTEPGSYLVDHVTQLAQAHSCDTSGIDKMLQCLRSLPWVSFKDDNICEILPCIEVDPLFKPIADGVVIQGSIASSIQEAAFPVNIPYMTGTVRAEFGDHYTESFTRARLSREVDSFVMQKYGSAAAHTIMYHYTDWSMHHKPIANNSQFFIENYKRAEVLTDMGLVAPTAELASSLAAQQGSQVYLYYLDNQPSFHSVELNYVFGIPFIGGSVDEMGVITTYSELDKEKSRFFMETWVNFAKYGKPMLKPNLVAKEWTNVKPDTMDYLHIDFTQPQLNATMRHHLQGPEVALWNILVPEVAQSCSNAISDSDSFHIKNRKTWIFFGLTVALLLVVILLLCIIIWGSQRNKKYTQLLRNNSEKSYAVNL